MQEEMCAVFAVEDDELETIIGQWELRGFEVSRIVHTETPEYRFEEGYWDVHFRASGHYDDP